MLQKMLQSPDMPNYANLRSRPKIQAIKPSKRDSEFYRHDGDALQGLRDGYSVPEGVCAR